MARRPKLDEERVLQVLAAVVARLDVAPAEIEARAKADAARYPGATPHPYQVGGLEQTIKNAAGELRALLPADLAAKDAIGLSMFASDQAERRRTA